MTNRHLVVTLIAIIALIFMVVPVMAEDFYESDYATWAAIVPAQDINLVATINEIRFNNIEKYHSLESVTLIYPNAVRMRKSTDQTTFIAKIGADEIGRGTLLVNQNYHSDGTYKSAVISADFSEWDIKAYSGSQRVSLSIDTSNGFEFFTRAGNPYAYLTKTRISDPDGVLFVAWQDGNPDYPYYYGGAMSVYGRYNWALSLNYDDGFAYLDRHGYSSYVSICDSALPELEYYAKTSASDEIVDCMKADSINVLIKSGKGTIYNRVYTLDVPGDPDGSGITVYIKNSQTGALIANANVVIDALVDGEYYPVTNRTEPSGIFSINLQPTGGGKPNPDGYRLIVTADGYNNPMPEINFTLGDYIKYFECFLDPIAGGPVNENKTFIDFFVRDMSSNPISGATVKFGEYTLITNSAGYTVFEVDKNNNYSWTVTKSGYGPLTGNAVIGNDPRHTINTVLAPIVTPTITTPIPTSPPIGPTPTMTAPTGEHVSNWLEWFAAHFGMILGGGVEIGKIFMWLCFTVPVGVYVGKEAKAGAAGFMAGAGIVTLFFVLIGWVPIWLVVLLALIIGLLYAKVFNAQDNGGGR